MFSLLRWLSFATSVILVFRVFMFRQYLIGLTLTYSWCWAVVAAVALLVMTLASGNAIAWQIGWKTAVQYLSVVMLLTPAVATLGARRPGVGAWQFFVVAPLILVLLWPCLSQLISSRGREALELGAPAISGVFLVLLMSAGTGLGTSLSVSTLLYVASAFCCVLPSCGWITSTSTVPLLAAPLLLIAEVLAGRVVLERYRAMDAGKTGAAVVDETWLLFQDLYGLVWARRVLDRVNQFAQREQWTVRLTMDGFRRADNGELTANTELQRPLEALSWVLSRFVDDSWLDRRFDFYFGIRQKEQIAEGIDRYRRVFPTSTEKQS